MSGNPVARLSSRVRQCLAKLETTGVAVAFSGGADSTALLLAASQAATGLPLRAIHIDHAVQDQSGQWAAHCQRVADRLGVALTVQRLSAGHSGPVSETRLREARYREFERLLNHREVLLTAHHRDDVAETTLLAMMRGGSTSELAGVPALRPLGAGFVARPLLGEGRQDLLKAVTSSGLDWIEDPSNADPQHPRSLLRQQVLPLLEPAWPQAAKRIAATALRQRDNAVALNEAIDELVFIGGAQDQLPIQTLTGRSDALALAVLRRWLQRLGSEQPAHSSLQELLRQLRSTGGDSAVNLAMGDAMLRRYRDRLWLVRDCGPPPNQVLSWHEQQRTLPGRLGSMAWRQQPEGCSHAWPKLSVRFGVEGLRLQPADQNHRRSLKKLYQEAGVPPWERVVTPLVFRDEQPLMVGNLYKTRAMLDLERQLGARGVWLRS